MIFQFNKDNGSGLVMLTNGETKEFSVNDWVDTSNEAAVGLKVSYEKGDTFVKIQTLKNEGAVSAEKEEAPVEEKSECSSVDEYVEHYVADGYKLVRDINQAGVRRAILRRFLEDGHGEVIVTEEDSKISLTTLVNGKEVQ